MKNKVFIFIIFSFTYNLVYTQNNKLELFLKTTPDIIYNGIKVTVKKSTFYELEIKQPLDHNDKTEGHFYQLVYLTHRGFKEKTVMAIEGYSIVPNTQYELTKILKGNQINIEHRFFGKSLPDSLNYKYLNLEQASTDLHHIHELFKDIYPDKWVSTGISKGGTSSLFYKYFYPEDVSACVAYVAPLANSIEDKRIYNFLDTVGTDICRQKIKSFQSRLLENRDQVIPILENLYNEKGYEFTYLTFEESFEYSVLEFSFSVW